MFVDYLTKTVSTGPYLVTVTPLPGAVRVSITYSFDPAGNTLALSNVFVWADGVLAGQAWRLPAEWTADGRTAAWNIPVAAPPVTPGPADLVVSLWDQDPQSAKLIAAVKVAGSAGVMPVPCLVPGKVVRSLFTLYPTDLRGDAGLEAAVRAAGVNTLMVGAFKNPADTAGINTIEDWRALMDATAKPQYDAAAALGGFHLLATGDDLFRTAAERGWHAVTPWAEAAVQEAAARMAAAGVIGVEMVDETAGGPDDDPAYRLVCGWLRSVPGCPPFAWPNQAPILWEGSDLADYCSRFWSSVDYRNGRLDGGMTLPQVAGGIGRAAAGRPPGLAWPAGKPWLCEVSAAGVGGGVTAADVVAQVWLALAYGSAGVRVYAYDWPEWVAQRAAGDPNAQQGTKPGDARWPGLAAAFNTVAAREVELTAGHSYPAGFDGPWVRGRRGDLSWAVNILDTTCPSLTAGTLLTPAGESAVAAGGVVPSGGVVLSH